MLTIRRILVPADGGPCGAAAYRFALPIARRFDAAIHLVRADCPNDEVDDDSAVALPPPPPDVRLVEAEAAGDTLAQALLDYAWMHDVDLAIVGTHGRRGLAHFFLGSVAERLVREAACPVLTVRADGEAAGAPAAEAPEVRRLLVPSDFSARSEEAVRYAAALAELYDAKVDLLHVVDVPLVPDVYGVGLLWEDVLPDVVTRTQEALAETARAELGARMGDVHVEIGSPASAVLHAVERLPADLVVMATHGRTGLKRFALGSVAERVVQHAECPVFVVKSFGKSLLGAPAATEYAAAAAPAS